MSVPWVTREQIEPFLKIPELFTALEKAFTDFSAGLGDSPVAVLRPSAGSDLHLKAATLRGHEIFTVKAAGWSSALAKATGNGSSGIIVVFDSVTCLPKLVIDDRHMISDVRTAATGALAARECARMAVKTVGVIGTGTQASLQLSALKVVRNFERVLVWGRTQEKVASFCASHRDALPGTLVDVAASAKEVVEVCDILITATSSREPLVMAEWLHPGMHITAVGADDEEKCELDPGVFALADRIFVDSIDLTGRYGDIRRAIAEGRFACSDIDGELGDVFSGRLRGRTSEDDITVVKLVGLGIQDLAVVEHLLTRLEGTAVSDATLRQVSVGTRDGVDHT